MQRVAVVDYGGSNLRSVVKALEHVASAQFSVEVVSTPEALRNADRVVFLADGRVVDEMESPTAERILDHLKRLGG